MYNNFLEDTAIVGDGGGVGGGIRWNRVELGGGMRC